jgi:hypothetical protein
MHTEEDEKDSLQEHPKLYSDIKWAPMSLGRACSLLMMPFVLGIVALTYVPYIYRFNNGTFYGGFCLVIFHVLLSLMMVSYFQVSVSQ